MDVENNFQGVWADEVIKEDFKRMSRLERGSQ